MKIVFCTNIWNHHQGPVCTELAKLLGDDFMLLLHQPLDHRYSIDRIKLGWNLIPPNVPWIVGPPKSCADIDYSGYIRYAMDADVLILDSMVPFVDNKMLKLRHSQGKINMRMGERIYRGGRPWWYLFSPKKWIGRLISHFRFESPCVHFLTMGHWCVNDLRYLHACKGRTWRWGYLTPVSASCAEKPKRDQICIGWCGRMLFLKQVDLILKAYASMPEPLKAKSCIRLVGNGEAEASLRHLATDLGIVDSVRFDPMMSQVDAKKFLEGLDIFVFSSNAQEGWGATLLEAMDKGCAVIANTAAGATLEVVEDGVNGFVFTDGDVGGLSAKMAWLIENDKVRHNIGQNAWETIQSWSPRVGAERLVKLVHGLYAANMSENYKSGLCSKVW